VTHPNPSTALARVVVDQLAVEGVQVVVVSPGSRSGALAIAAAEHPELRARVVIDERSAAFHALGVARAGGRPAAVLCTSGTAAANFFPAVVEADLSCVPLIAMSADRPVEMRGVGSNQTIDQIDLYGSKVRRFADIPAPGAERDLNQEWRRVVQTSVMAATGSRPGPVHLNVAFREPTVPATDDGRISGDEYPFETPRIDVARRPEQTAGGDPLPEIEGGRGLIIAGDGQYDRPRLLEQAASLGWPVLATALSGARGEGVITAYHHLLAQGVPDGLVPDVVVAVGAIGPSSRLEHLVAAAAMRVRIDRWGRVVDPFRNAHHILTGDVNELLHRARGSAEPDWAEAWRSADEGMRQKLRATVMDLPAMTGAHVAMALDAVSWGSLVAASSLPIREADAHLTRPGPVHANRGASGIDGFVSTALGIASVVPRTVALAGDISLIHDSNGFVGEIDMDLCVVVVDNGGGGLFDDLPQATLAPQYERLFVTPPRRDLAKLADLHGLEFHEVDDPTVLPTVISRALDEGGLTLIRVPVDREHDRAARAQLDG